MKILENKSGLVWIGASQLTLLVSNFFLLKRLTSEFDVLAFGKYSLFMSIALFVRQILYDPISIVLGKECSASVAKKKDSTHELTSLIFIIDFIGLVLIFSGLAVYFLGVSFFKENEELLLIFLCIVYIVGNGSEGVYFNALNSIKERKLASIFASADAILKVVLVSFVFAFGWNSLGPIYGAISFGVIFIFFILRYVVKDKFISTASSFQEKYRDSKYYIQMSLPFILSTILIATKSVGDRWMMAGVLGIEDLANYSVLLQIGYAPILLFFGIFQTYIAPQIFGYCASQEVNGHEELMSFLKKILIAILFTTIVASCFGFFSASYIFKILVGKSFHDLTGYLPFFMVAGAFSAAAGILQIAIIGLLNSKQASNCVVITLMIGVGSTALLMKLYGFTGAVLGLVFSGLETGAIFWFAINRAVTIKNKSV